MNDSRIHRNIKITRDERASESISEQAPYFFTRRAADVVSEVCFTAMTEDHHHIIPVLFFITKLYLLYEC